MMLRATIILIILSLHAAVMAQDCACRIYNGYSWSEDTQASDTLIDLDGNRLAICGYFGETFLNEFTITDCGTQKGLDFYGAIRNYTLSVEDDTLTLTDYRYLPTNEMLELDRIPWAKDQYFFVEGRVVHQRRIVYNPIVLVIDDKFKGAWSKEIRGDWSANVKLIAWSFLISLNDTDHYTSYFKTYRDTFQLGGANAEYYIELSDLYKEYLATSEN